MAIDKFGGASQCINEFCLYYRPISETSRSNYATT